MEVPIIQTPRLRLRGWCGGDIDAMAGIYADPEVQPQLSPMTRAETEEQIAYFAAHWEQEGFGLWAVEDRATGSMIGRVGLIRHLDFPEEPDPVEVGWTLAPAVWGRGLATEGAEASLALGFRTVGLARIISITRATNARSRRVMETCGLKHEGPTRWRGLEQVYHAIDRGTWEARNG